MSILIKDMEMPTNDDMAPTAVRVYPNGYAIVFNDNGKMQQYTEAVPVPPHGRLIDADALRRTMYHEAFEQDSPMQKWDSGCWIRYKMFERALENAPTVIEAEVFE